MARGSAPAVAAGVRLIEQAFKGLRKALRSRLFGLSAPEFSAYNSGMPLQVDAVYENGVLRPLQPLDLKEHEHVLVSVLKTAPTPGRSSLAVEYIEKIKRELRDAESIPGIAEVRRRLSKISGSMAAEIIAERGER